MFSLHSNNNNNSMPELIDFVAKEINNIDVNDNNDDNDDDDDDDDDDKASSSDVDHNSLDCFIVDDNADLDSYVRQEDDYCLKNLTRSVESALET